MNRLLTRIEAAELLGISSITLDRMRKEGQIAYIQRVPGGKVWISEDAISEYISKSTHPARNLEPVVRTYRKRRK